MKPHVQNFILGLAVVASIGLIVFITNNYPVLGNWIGGIAAIFLSVGCIWAIGTLARYFATGKTS